MGEGANRVTTPRGSPVAAMTLSLAINHPFLSSTAMGRETLPQVPMGSDAAHTAALQHGPWRMTRDLSSGLEQVERFLVRWRFDLAPWALVALVVGIASWFITPTAWHWSAVIVSSLGLAVAGIAFLRVEGRYPYLRLSLAVTGVAVALGCALVWAKAELVGAQPIARPVAATLEATVLDREDQPAERRVRLILATREPGSVKAVKVRLNLALDQAPATIVKGARVRLRARLVPPPAPMLPGGYDFARTAWFSGIAATGSVIGPVEVLEEGRRGPIASAQRKLSEHVRANLDGSAGTIAAALASGDRGSIAEADDKAMRDAGLTHLLSVSGLHVSAVVAAGYVLAMRLLGLFPWLVLRVRLPLVAAGAGALAGIGYTLLTGAELPTIRSCIGAVLVLLALAMGRDPLSMRMVAIAAFLILLFWPESLIGPSFQMSFAAVVAIIALHGSPAMRAFNAPREESWIAKSARHLLGLLLTGVVIELALMPIVLFHFHRAGVYGALANVVAIPLTTLASMPLIALALLFDLVGLGAPFWWLAGNSLELLLALAHWVSAMPGAVTTMPTIGRGIFALFVAGGLWLALWRSRIRWFGFVPVAAGLLLLNQIRTPDLLVSSDGRHVGITGEASDDLLVLRDSKSGYTRDNLLESAGMSGATRPIADWPGANCNTDFCAITLKRGEQSWRLLIGRGTDFVPERSLAAACDRVDIVIAGRYLPGSCRPRWLKVDRRMLDQTGGMTIDLTARKLVTVAQNQGRHGWWKPAPPNQPSAKLPPGTTAKPATASNGAQDQ